MYEVQLLHDEVKLFYSNYQLVENMIVDLSKANQVTIS